MIYIPLCTSCVHRRDFLINGWIPSCDAFPDGVPMDFDEKSIDKTKECNNGIGYEEAEE